MEQPEVATEAVDGPTWQEIAHKADQIAKELGEWCGSPVPIDSYRLSLAKGFCFPGLDGFRLQEEHEPEHKTPGDMTEEELLEVLCRHGTAYLNEWYSMRKGGTVVVYRLPHGKSRALIEYDCANRHAAMFTRQLIPAMETAFILDPEAELTAIDKLKTLIKPHLWSAYVLHGMFLETSKRSKVTYVFRKGRPTLAMRPNADANMKILCALCLHPIGYYEGTFCGTMVPTDEVISHLLLMRADEHRYWRQANQHPVHAWQSGL